MIEFLPRSLCSWDFTAHGLSSGPAVIAYEWITEQGMIVVGKSCYDVKKHGLFSGHWTLELVGRVIAQAQKPSALFRSFEVSSDEVCFTLAAQSPFQRAFEIVSEDRVVGSIVPAHAFTRRAVMECSDAISEHVQLFAFWLAALTWKRSANHNSAAGT